MVSVLRWPFPHMSHRLFHQIRVLSSTVQPHSVQPIQGFSASASKVRSHTCGELRHDNVGQSVTLCGWIHTVRFKKFLVLRDSFGFTQVRLESNHVPEEIRTALPPKESIVCVTGIVVARPPKDATKMPTGEIEVVANDLRIMNPASSQLAFVPSSKVPVNELIRLTYRYLDLRSHALQRNLQFRSQLILAIRNFLCAFEGFIEVETPYLFKRTPGGAREFVTPTGFPGLFYSLPQSPQQFKQLLMVGGVDRYMQIARCFRDEPSRSDRQPEFTQLDIEMAFVGMEDVYRVIESLFEAIWPLVRDVADNEATLMLPFDKMDYHTAMSRFGSDKPDVRFDSCFCDPTDNGHVGFSIRIPQQFQPTIDEWVEMTSKIKSETGIVVTWSSMKSIPVNCSSLGQILQARSTDTIVYVDCHSEKHLKALGTARTKLAALLDQKGHEIYKPGLHFLWVHDFPLFEHDFDGSWKSVHHPFTAPTRDTESLVHIDPARVVGQHYDLVCNGQEIGGGSIRIHNAALQEYILSEVLKEDVEPMNYFMMALKSGAPPHGGIALGLDRLIAIFLSSSSIRDVIAFPKAADGKDLMCGAPTKISEEDLKHYKITLVE